MRIKKAFLPLTLILFLIALCLACLGGCGPIVTPKQAALFDTTAANARAYAEAVKNDPTVPAGVRSWITADAHQWTDVSNWAHGKPAATQP